MDTPRTHQANQVQINDMTLAGGVTYFDTTMRLDGQEVHLVIGTNEAPELEAAWRSCVAALIRAGKARIRSAPAIGQP
jgi:hypothetical protein